MIRRIPHVAAAATFALLAACSETPATAPDAAVDPTLAVTSITTPAGAAIAAGSRAGRVETLLRVPSGAPFATAKGTAKFKSKPGERELQVEVENIPAGTALTITLGSTVVGTATANSLREARLELNTEAGQSVPTAVAGQAVVVTRTGDGAVVVRGSF